MADLTIVAASVVPGSDAAIEYGTAGATITQGQVVYKEASSGKYKLADCDSATAEIKVARGISLNGGSDGQPMAILTSGDITIGATLVAGTPYYLSDGPGGIRTTPDTGDYIVLLGIAKSTTVLALRIQIPGVTLP